MVENSAASRPSAGSTPPAAAAGSRSVATPHRRRGGYRLVASLAGRRFEMDACCGRWSIREDGSSRRDPEGVEHSVTIRRRADARIGHDEDPRATGRGDHLGESLDRARPRTGPGCAASSRSDGRRARAMPADLDHDIDAGVAADRQPAPAAGRVEPALGRHAVGVLEDPDLVEVALVGVGRSSRASARRSPPNVNSSSGRRPQRGQSSHSISASPPSPGRPGRGRAGSGRG